MWSPRMRAVNCWWDAEYQLYLIYLNTNTFFFNFISIKRLGIIFNWKCKKIGRISDVIQGFLGSSTRFLSTVTTMLESTNIFLDPLDCSWSLCFSWQHPSHVYHTSDVFDSALSKRIVLEMKHCLLKYFSHISTWWIWNHQGTPYLSVVT